MLHVGLLASNCYWRPPTFQLRLISWCSIVLYCSKTRQRVSLFASEITVPTFTRGSRGSQQTVLIFPLASSVCCICISRPNLGAAYRVRTGDESVAHSHVSTTLTPRSSSAYPNVPQNSAKQILCFYGVSNLPKTKHSSR